MPDKEQLELFDTDSYTYTHTEQLEDSKCWLCGGTTEMRKCKLICLNCHSILATCTDL